MIKRWRAWLALGPGVAGPVVALSDRCVHPLDATVLVLPPGGGDERTVRLGEPARDLEVIT